MPLQSDVQPTIDQSGQGDNPFNISRAPVLPYDQGILGSGINFLFGPRESRHPEAYAAARGQQESEASSRILQGLSQRVKTGMTPQAALVDFLNSPEGAYLFSADAGNLFKNISSFTQQMSPEQKIVPGGQGVVERNPITGETKATYTQPLHQMVPITDYYGRTVGVVTYDVTSGKVVSAQGDTKGVQVGDQYRTPSPGATPGQHPLISRNNPGAIVYTPGMEKIYPGVVGKWTNPATGYTYAQFDTMENGQKAIGQVLQRFGPGPLVNSISMYTAGKPFEQLQGAQRQNVLNYATFVGKAMGIGPNTEVDFRNPQTLQAALPAIQRWEMGQPVNTAGPNAPAAQPGTPGTPGVPPYTPTKVPPGAPNEKPSGEATLWSQVKGVTGAVPSLLEKAQGITGQIGVDVTTPQFRQARSAFELASQDFLKQIAANKRYPIAEQQHIRDNVSIGPNFFRDEATLYSRLDQVDRYVQGKINDAEREFADPKTPPEEQKKIATDLQALQNFKRRLGVPPLGSQERMNPPRSTFQEQYKQVQGAVKKTVKEVQKETGVGQSTDTSPDASYQRVLKARQSGTQPDPSDLRRLSLDQLRSLQGGR